MAGIARLKHVHEILDAKSSTGRLEAVRDYEGRKAVHLSIEGGFPVQDIVTHSGNIRGIYWGYIGIMENEMETTI